VHPAGLNQSPHTFWGNRIHACDPAPPV